MTPRVGDSLPEVSVSQVSDEHIRLMALLLRDPNPIHFDLDAVASAGLGDRLVNQGACTMAYALNALTAWAGASEAIERFECRFTASVLAGDAVVAGGTVTGVAEDERTAEVEVYVDRADGVRVMTGAATVRV